MAYTGESPTAQNIFQPPYIDSYQYITYKMGTCIPKKQSCNWCSVYLLASHYENHRYDVSKVGKHSVWEGVRGGCEWEGVCGSGRKGGRMM